MLGAFVGAIILAKVLGWVGGPVIALIACLGIAGIAGALLIPKPPRPALEPAHGVEHPRRDPRPRGGDRAKIEQTVGTVELIGLRSTRACTRFEIHLRLGLARSQQLYDIGARMEALLACHPAIAGYPPSVHPIGRGAARSGLEAMAWFDAPDWTSFQLVCDQLLLACLEICHERAHRPAGAITDAHAPAPGFRANACAARLPAPPAC